MRSSPIQVGSGFYRTLALGNNSTMAIDPYGTLSAWGQNLYGQAGTNSITSYSWTQLSNGDTHSLALRSDSTLWGWGQNSNGQLGLNDTVNRQSPTQINATINGVVFSNWNSVSAGASHSVGITSDGTTWAWGLNTSGQVADLSIFNRSAPVQVGSTTSLSNANAYSYAFNGANYLSMNNAVLSGSSSDITIEFWIYPTNNTISNQGLFTGGLNGLSIQLQSSGLINIYLPNFLATGGWNGNVTVSFNTWTHFALTRRGNAWRVFSNGVLRGWTSDTRRGDNTISMIGYGTNGSGTNLNYFSGFLSNLRYIISNTFTDYDGPGGTTGGVTYFTPSTAPLTAVTGTALLTCQKTTVTDASSNTIALTNNNTVVAGSIYTPLSSYITAGSGAFYASKVSAGKDFTLAIKNDNTLYSWGLNTSYQLGSGTTTSRSSPVQVGTSSWALISAGATHALAIDINNLLYGWGTQTSGQLGLGDTALRSQPTQIGASSYIAISAGYSHSLAITSDNKLFTWGNNVNGQLGFNVSFIAISAGSSTSSIIRSDGTVWTWGLGSSGQLGDGTTVTKSSPVAVGLLKTWSNIAKPSFTEYAIDNTSKLYAWGENSTGSVGDGTVISRSSPVQIGTSSWTMVTVSLGGVAGQQTAYAIRSDGALFAWGNNSYGQSVLSSNVPTLSPVQIGSSSWSTVSAGLQFVMAITSNGKLFGWGRNDAGQLGITPSTFSWTKVSSSGLHTLAIRSDNLLFAWGTNANGQLGTGDTTNRSSPVQIASGSYTQVSAGLSNSYAIRSDGSLYSWGDNSFGQLGDSTVSALGRSSPAQVGTSSWTSVNASAYTNTVFAIRNDNKLYGWGDNTSGQIGILGSFKTIATTFQGAFLGLKTDGSLWSWGVNTTGVLGLNDTINRSSPIQIGTSSWTMVVTSNDITAGFAAAFGITTTGALYAWGGNTSTGKLGLGDTVNRSSPVQVPGSWVSVASHSNSTGAIDNTGKLFTWGLNTAFSLGTGDATSVARSSPVQISVGTSYTSVWASSTNLYAIKNDGTMWGIGNNTNGQLGQSDILPSRSLPVQIGVGSSWNMVAGGNQYALAIRKDGALFSWGANAGGQFGDATTVSRSSPVQLPGTTSWVYVSATSSSVGAIDSTSKLFTWGQNTAFGILGLGDTNSRSSPVQVGTTTNNSYVGIGASNGSLITTTGDLFLWGVSTNGGLGGVVPTASTTNRSSPVQLPSSTYPSFSSPVQVGASSWSQVSTGGGFTLGIKSDSTLWSWGVNSIGQLGVSTASTDLTQSKFSPVQIGTSSWTNVSAGGSHASAIRVGGSLFTWGLNSSGQLGNGAAPGDTVNRSSPVQVGTSSWTSVSAGGTHTIANRYGDNQLFTWGFNTQGQLGSGVTAARSSPVQVNAYSTTTTNALTFNGTTQYLSGGTNLPMITTGLFTIEAWINWNGTGTSPAVCGNEGWSTGNNAGFYLFLNSTGTISLGASAGVFNTQPIIYTSTNTVPASTWTHIAMTRDGSNAVRTFINGVVDPTVTTITQSLNLQSGTTPIFHIGAVVRDGAIGQAFPGQISNLRIVPRVAVYTTSFTPPTTALTATQSAGTNIAAITGIPSNGYSVWFNGSNMYLTVPYSSVFDIPINTAVTFECWVYTNSTASEMILAGRNWAFGGSGPTWGFQLINGVTPRWSIAGTGSATYVMALSTLSGTLGQWNHYAFTRDSSNVVNIWVNGFSGVTRTDGQAMTSASGDVYIGVATNLAAASYFSGNISNMRMVKGQALYTNTFTPSTSPLTTTSQGATASNVSLLVCQSTTIIDNGTGNGGVGFTITNVNSTVVSLAYSPFGTQATILAAQGPAVTSDNSINAYTFTNVATVTQASVTPFVAPLSGPSSSAGASGSAALGSAGTLHVWGLGTNGQIGDNTIVSKSIIPTIGTLTSTVEYSPIQVGSSSWNTVSAGSSHSLAIRTDNTVWAWGLNSSGQLGIGDTSNRSSPVQIASVSYAQINAGATHSMAIDTSNKLYGWGLNSSGQTGDGTSISRSAPTQIGLLNSWTTVSAGVDHTMALNSLGSLFIWGIGTSGQLGDNTIVTKSSPILLASMSIPNQSSPTQIGTSSYTIVRAGNNFSTAISSDNKLFLWGLGTSGQLGTSVIISRSSPVQISTTKSYILVSTAASHTTFVAADSPQVILGTGWNNVGQLGTIGGAGFRSSPVQVGASATTFNSPVTISVGNYSSYYVSSPTQVGTSSWTSVSAGGTHTLGVKYDNTLWAWGYNANGQLGGSDTINRSSPVQIGTSSWSQVSSGDSHNIILKSDGTINTFGLNSFGQLGDGT